jgi:hypothetical protein
MEGVVGRLEMTNHPWKQIHAAASIFFTILFNDSFLRFCFFLQFFFFSFYIFPQMRLNEEILASLMGDRIGRSRHFGERGPFWHRGLVQGKERVACPLVTRTLNAVRHLYTCHLLRVHLSLCDQWEGGWWEYGYRGWWCCAGGRAADGGNTLPV